MGEIVVVVVVVVITIWRSLYPCAGDMAVVEAAAGAGAEAVEAVVAVVAVVEGGGTSTEGEEVIMWSAATESMVVRG
jgi:hypothetical protein